MNIINIEMKTTNICNMKCKYCYTPSFINSETMTEKNILQSIDQVKVISKYYKNIVVQFLWHGGEPTLLSDLFYRKLTVLQKERLKNVKFVNFIQTNGLYLRESLLELLRESRFTFGISIDGPKELHDLYRVDTKEDSSFERVMHTMALLKYLKIPTVVNCVLKKCSLDSLDDLFYFFKELNTNITFNILLPSKGKEKHKLENENLSYSDYGDAIVILLDYWLSEDKYTGLIDTFNYMVRSIVLNKEFGCFKAKCPQFHRAFTPTGSSYVCGRFYGWDDYSLKINYINNKISSIESETVSKYPELICDSCPIESLCRGGCSYNRVVFANALYKKDPYCESYLKIYGFVNNNRKLIEKKIKKSYSLNSDFFSFLSY